MRDALTTGVRIDLLETYTTQLLKRVKNLSRLIAKKKKEKKEGSAQRRSVVHFKKYVLDDRELK